MQRRQKSYVRPRYYRQWTEDEEHALQRGVEKHGVGSWESIRKDPDLGILRDRTGVQLKDKWRNMVKFKHVPHVLAAQATPAPCDGSRHSDGLTGALNHLDLSCHDGDAITTATTDDDQEGSTRSGRSRGRKSRARRPPIAHEDKRYGIYDVRRYMVAKNGTTREEQFQTTPTTQDGVVRCCCGAMADDGAMMVECEQCLVWSHVHCLQRLAATHPTFKPNLTAFVCSDCQAATNGALTAAAHWPTDASIDDALSHDDTAANTLSPFALPGADPASVSEESLVDSLASYAKHPEGKVHGGSLAMFALAASSLGAGSDDLFADLPGLDDALAMETTTGAMDSPATPWATLDNLSVPRSCPDRPVGVSRWADGAYGGALAASLAHTPCVPSTLLGRGGSPPSSMSYVSSGDVYGMTPSSSLNASSANMSSSVPSPMYSPAGKRTAHHLSGPPIVRGGVSKVVGYPSSGVHRLDTAMSTSTSTLEFMSRTWLAAQPTTHDASSPDSIVASRAVMPDVELLDTVLFNEHDWPLPC